MLILWIFKIQDDKDNIYKHENKYVLGSDKYIQQV